MKQKQEGACAVGDCKVKPIFGPILMPNHDLTFKEAYLCAECKELLVREVTERVIARSGLAGTMTGYNVKIFGLESGSNDSIRIVMASFIYLR